MKITVKYPTEVTNEVLVGKDTVYNPWHPERNQDRLVSVSVPVNQPVKIYVRRTERAIKEMFMTNEDHSVEQTGLTPQEYQAKHGKAWNE